MKITKAMARIGLVFVVLSALYLIFLLSKKSFKDSDQHDYQRSSETAASLEARGLYDAALDELDRYRQTAPLTREKEADLLFKMAQMADDQLGDCNRALPYYTMADALRPDAPWSADSGKKSVICLEKLGKSKESAALMNQLTGGTAPDAAAGPAAGDTSPVVALVDGRSVTWNEVSAALAPGDTAALDLRQKLVHEYVVTWLLSEESVRKGYDSDPAAKARAEWARRQALAVLLVAREVGKPGDEQAVSKLIDEIVKLHHVRTFKDAVPAP